MEHIPSRRANSHSVSRKIYPPFMEPEGLLLRSQEPTNSPCPEPDESIPQLPTVFL